MPSLTQQICEQCADGCVIDSLFDYNNHISIIHKIINGKSICPPNYPYLSWLYACEAYELKNDLPSKVKDINNSSGSTTK